jgi:hypothetical protein
MSEDEPCLGAASSSATAPSRGSLSPLAYEPPSLAPLGSVHDLLAGPGGSVDDGAGGQQAAG